MRYAMAVVTLVTVFHACSPAQNKGTRDAEFYYSLAVNSYYDQNAQAALRDLDTCFKMAPDHVQAHNLAGLIHMGRKEYVDSLRHFEKVVALDPDFLDGQANLGALYMAMNDWHKALEILQPLARNPLYATPYLVENNVGWIYYNLKNFQQAEAHLKRALFLNDKLCLAYNNLGILHSDLERWDEAQDDFEAAVSRCANYTEAWFRLGGVLERRGQYQDAARKFAKCRKLGGESLYGRRCKRKLQVMR